MPNNRLSELTISFVKRNARARGPTSSEAWNDSIDELSRDLTTIYSEWNNSLIPLLSLLPGQEDNYNVDAFTDGLDGRTMFVNSEASTTDAEDYYNTGLVRPNTIYEQFQDLYAAIETRVNTVQEQIDNVALSAADIPIADDGAVFTSGTVEGALQEVMNLVARTGTDHGALTGLSDDDHTQYLPRSGVRAMTGNLQMGGKNITNAAAIACTSLASSGSILSSKGFDAGIGFTTGAGTTATQSTSKSTTVTLSSARYSGRITMHNEALAAGAEVSFVVNGLSGVSLTDVPVVAIRSGATVGAYAVQVSAVASNSFTISVTNLSTGSLSEAIVLNYIIFKASNA